METKITSTKQARKALESGDIHVGSILVDTEGFYKVTWIASEIDSNIVCEAVEQFFDYETDDLIDDPEENSMTHRWTLADLIDMEY